MPVRRDQNRHRRRSARGADLLVHRLPEILMGQMDELVGALITADEAERLAGLDQ